MSRHFRSASATALALALCAASSVSAQEALPSQRQEAMAMVVRDAAAQEEEDRKIVQEQGPADREGFSPSDPTFQLLAGSDESEVSLGLTFDSSSTSFDEKKPLERRTATTRFSVHGFAPIDKDGGDRFVNLAKPMSGSRLKFGLVHYFSNYTLSQADIDTAVSVMNLSFGNCIRRRVDAWAARQPAAKQETARTLAESYRTRLASETGRHGEVEQAMAVLDRDATFDDLKGETGGCRVGIEGGVKNNEELIARYGDRSRIDAAIRGVTALAPTYFFGGDATFGRKEFSFLDRATFAVQDKTKNEYELSAFAGMISGDGMWSLRGGVSHSRTYKAQDEIELCQATTTPGQTQCLSGADGRPARTEVTALTLEGRLLLTSLSSKMRIGIAPELAFDPDSNEYSIDVPIYFAPNKDGQLSGGVRVGYASEKKDLSFGLFVGVPFSTFQ